MRFFMKYTIATIVVVFSSIVSIIFMRTLSLSVGTKICRKCSNSNTKINNMRLTNNQLENFQQALRFHTVSWDKHYYNNSELYKFVQFIVNSFPSVHSSRFVKHELVANYSLLYTVLGSDRSLAPYMLCAHLDVVPADRQHWDADPFSGDIIGDYIYGRGAIDDKQMVMGILEGLEFLLSNGFRPRRSFYIAFGHDEEVYGLDGASSITETLALHGVESLEFIYDEGLTVTKGIVAGVTDPIASVGVTEKGSVLLKLTVTGEPGHSSMPTRGNPISVLSSAVQRLENNPHRNMLGRGPEHDFFAHIAHKMPFFLRLVLANLWLFRPIVGILMAHDPILNAIGRTVTSVTMFNSGVKANVMPLKAEAIVNHRIHPSQTVKEVVDYDAYIINDHRVQVDVLEAQESHPVAGTGDGYFGYNVLKKTICQIWTDATVAPAVLVGNTDTRHYLRFTHNVYRFSPTFMLPGDEKRFHGRNERISKKNYEQVIYFYYNVMRNADEPFSPTVPHHGGEL